MSVIGRSTERLECVGEGASPYLLSHFLSYTGQEARQSCWEVSSVGDVDRPHSSLTLVESPCDSHDQDEEGSLVDLDSADLTDDAYPCSPTGRSAAYCCEECLKCFSSPGKLRQHEYSHTGETPFECDVPGCVKRFTSKFKLKRHILIHSQTKTFTCDICKRAFRRKDHLKNHEKVHDPGKTVYSCSYDSCNRTYNSLSSYKKHQAMHSAEDGQLDCKICRTVLLNQDELMNHLKLHTGSRPSKGTSDKKFCCVQCDKKFFTRKDLKRHSVVHTGNREFSCPHCTQRFGRKDHMTRHAKKTHQQFYESERQRVPSTPNGCTQVEAARNSRKERSVSDPGPMQSGKYGTDFAGQGLRPLLSPVKEGLQRLGYPDPTLCNNYALQDSKPVINTGLRTIYLPPIHPLSTTISPIGNSDESRYAGPETINNAIAKESLAQAQLHDEDNKLSLEPVRRLYSNSRCVSPMNARHADRKLEMFSEDSNSAENAMKELLAEKDKIDFVSFINEISDDIFQRKPLDIVEPTVFCNVKEEPSSPGSPAVHVDHTDHVCHTDHAEPTLIDFSPEEELDTYSLIQQKVIPKPVFLRTQSQDSMTRTKNPVLPSIHTEGTLVVPEPKQVRYSSQDPFTLEFGDETQQLTELKGSLFMSDEDNQAYFQPWN